MLKKFFVILSIVILTFSMSSISLAKQFSDVKNTKYVKSVEMLTDLKIISGYEDDTFKPSKEIKRSEMAKLLIVALGKEAEVKTNIKESPFPDVPTTHWAIGYIKLASELDLIKGYPNGKFAPDDKVSYVESVALMLRALNYNKELDNLSWPDGYMNKAKEAKLLGSVTYKNSNDDATRGEISNMLWNTMNANTRVIVATNASGNVYGNGKVLLEKSFPSKYIGISDSIINDIDIEEKTITVKVNSKDKEFKYSDATETELKKMFGRTIEYAMYDQSAKAFLSFELDDTESVITGTVSKIKSGKIYIKDTGYTIPSDDKVKLVGISEIEDAEKVYMVMKNSTVKYMLVEGTEDLYIGIVSDSDVKIGKELAVEVTDVDGDDEEYVLQNQKAKISDDDIVIYALTSDDELVIKEIFDIDDSKKIESATSSSIKLKGEDKVTFAKSDDYVVVIVEDEYEITEGDLGDIYIKYDSAIVKKVNDTTFVIVFADGLEDIDEDSDDTETEVMTKSEAKAALKAAIKTAKAKSETTYTVVSWAKLENALDAAEDINLDTAKASKMQDAAEALERAIDNLKKATTADKTLRTKFSNLKDKIREAEALDKTDYTAESYAKVTTALTAAKKISLATTTLSKVETAISNLDSAIKLLVTNTTAENMQEAKTRLEKAKADAALIKKEDYTADSYADLEEALKGAEKIDYAKDGSAAINNVARNIEEALLALVSKADETKNNAIQELKDNIRTAKALTEATYTAESWQKLETELNALDAYNNVFTGLTLAQINTYNTKLESALDGLVKKIDVAEKENLIKDLKTRIDTAEGYTETTWGELGGTVSWTTLQTKLAAAKSAYNDRENKTLEQLQTVFDDLVDCWN